MGNITHDIQRMEVRFGTDPDDREAVLATQQRALLDSDTLRIEAKNTAVIYRQKIKDLKEVIDDCRMTLTQGKPEMREVKRTKNWSTMKVTHTDVKTGKPIPYLDRDITEDDKQQGLGETPEGEDEAKPKRSRKKKGEGEE